MVKLRWKNTNVVSKVALYHVVVAMKQTDWRCSSMREENTRETSWQTATLQSSLFMLILHLIFEEYFLGADCHNLKVI